MNKLFENHSLPLIAVSISFVSWFGLYFGLYALGWPGELHPCTEAPYCFCEIVSFGKLAAQPANTWSDLGFVCVAIFIAFHGSKILKKSGGVGKAYAQSPYLIALYSAGVLYMGPGSMFFHGAMTQWGGWLDVISMYVFVLFVISYLVYRSWNLSLKQFNYIYGLSLTLAVLLAIFAHEWSARIFPLVAAVLIGLALLQIIPAHKLALGRKLDLNMKHRWLVAALGFFITAITIWTLSDTGRPFCVPDSLLQGHAAWHLLSACMTLCIHFYFVSEQAQEAN